MKRQVARQAATTKFKTTHKDEIVIVTFKRSRFWKCGLLYFSKVAAVRKSKLNKEKSKRKKLSFPKPSQTLLYVYVRFVIIVVVGETGC